jgi:hypothetical protein
MGAMAVEIEEIASSRLAVPEVCRSLDIATSKEERLEQDLGDRKPALKLGGHARIEFAAPAPPEAVFERPFQRRTSLQPAPDNEGEADRRQDRKSNPAQPTGVLRSC